MLLPTLNRRSGMILGFKFSQNLFECVKHAETQLCVKHGQGKGDHSGRGEGSSDPSDPPLATGLPTLVHKAVTNAKSPFPEGLISKWYLKVHKRYLTCNRKADDTYLLRPLTDPTQMS